MCYRMQYALCMRDNISNFVYVVTIETQHIVIPLCVGHCYLEHNYGNGKYFRQTSGHRHW